MLSVFNNLSIVCVAVYMTEDMLSNIVEFNIIHELQQLYLHAHDIMGVIGMLMCTFSFTAYPCIYSVWC